MKILILIGMIIVFISAFFMFFIFDTSIRSRIICFTQSDIQCGAGWLGTVLTGAFMIAMFLIIDIITVYIIFTTALHEGDSI